MSEVVAHVEVRGRVQGVGFREFIRTLAQRLGVAGWIRNRDDGAVELAVAGDAGQVETLLAAAHRGPAGGDVQGVRTLPVDDHDVLPHPFVIRR